MSNLVKMVLTKDGTMPSLYNYFLGLNMLKYRRYLTMNDLIREDAGPVVDSTEFDCPLR
jgi:hypothetical protein